MSFFENEIQDVDVDEYISCFDKLKKSMIYGFDYDGDSCSFEQPKKNRSMIHGFDYDGDSCSFEQPKKNRSMIHGFDYDGDSCSFEQPKKNRSMIQEIEKSQDYDLNKKQIIEKNTTLGRYKVHFGDDLFNKGLSNKIFGSSSRSMKEKKTIKFVNGVVDRAVYKVVSMIEKVQSWNERLNYQC